MLTVHCVGVWLQARYGGRLSRALYQQLEAAALEAGGSANEWEDDQDE